MLASIVEVLDSVFTDLKLGTRFENSVNANLLEVESLRLELCKAKPVPKKTVARGKRVSLGANIAVCLYHIFQ